MEATGNQSFTQRARSAEARIAETKRRAEVVTNVSKVVVAASVVGLGVIATVSAAQFIIPRAIAPVVVTAAVAFVGSKKKEGTCLHTASDKIIHFTKQGLSLLKNYGPRIFTIAKTYGSSAINLAKFATSLQIKELRTSHNNELQTIMVTTDPSKSQYSNDYRTVRLSSSLFDGVCKDLTNRGSVNVLIETRLLGTENWQEALEVIAFALRTYYSMK